MKEFNLQKCMAGEPVVTRAGEDYKFGGFNSKAATSQQLVGWVNNLLSTHGREGKFYNDDRESRLDLFMKEVGIVELPALE